MSMFPTRRVDGTSPTAAKLDAPAAPASLPRPSQGKGAKKAGATRALVDLLSTGSQDALLVVAFHNARVRGGDGNRLVFPSQTLRDVWRLSIRLRPWLYPDPNPFPRLRSFFRRSK